MRQIKFRAYDKSDKSILDWDELLFMDLHWVLNNLEVMQFTGLLDKNGKEIYEGDYDQDYNVVTWCDKKMGWTMSIYDFPTKEFIACHCYDCEGHFEIRELKDIEIIGNIYEVAK